MKPVLFVGPSLPPAAQGAIGAAVTVLGPAACGDVARAAAAGAPAIGLVDGLFETTPAPWHKEILWALSRGIPVYGAASIGALRAVELLPFGMIGVGEVFTAFREGTISDDDEVAVVHGPAELGYRAVSEAMVNVRWTLAAVRAQGKLRADEEEAIARNAKAIFFKQRTWAAIWRAVEDTGSIAADRLATISPAIAAGQVDVKCRDAHALAGLLSAPRMDQYRPPGTGFVPTVYWERLRQRIGIDGTGEAGGEPYSPAASGT